MVCDGFKKVWMGVFAVMIRSLGFANPKSNSEDL